MLIEVMEAENQHLGAIVINNCLCAARFRGSIGRPRWPLQFLRRRADSKIVFFLFYPKVKIFSAENFSSSRDATFLKEPFCC